MTPDKTLLMDENEIRSALRQWQPEPHDFSTVVHEKVETAIACGATAISKIELDSDKARCHQWLRVAASVAPVHLDV